MTQPKVHRAIMVLAACFQNFACGGLIFGWAAISSSLLIAAEGGPGLSRAFVHHLFVIATSINFTAPLLLGILLDAYGPRVCSALSVGLVTAGFLLFSVSSEEFPGFLPAIVLIAFGGPGVQSSIIHLSNLYPTHKATVTSIITGSFNLSFIIFFLFDQLWSKWSLNFREIFLGYAFVCLFSLCISVFLWPDSTFTFQEQILEVVHQTHMQPDQLSSAKQGFIRAPSMFKKTTLTASYQRVGSSTTTVLAGGGAGTGAAGASGAQGEGLGLLSSSGSTSAANIKEGTFWEQVKSPAFIRVTILLVVASFWANFYIGTIDIQLADMAFLTPEAQGLMVRVFTAITTAGVLGIPVVGRLMDSCGFIATAAVTVTLAVLYAVGVLFVGKLQLILAFVAYAFFRTFLFTYFFAFLAESLGFKYFGVLAGVAFFMAGVAGLLQSPLMEIGAGTCHLSPNPQPDKTCFMGNWGWINMLQLACMASLYVVPILDLKAKNSNSDDTTTKGSHKPRTPLRSPRNGPGAGARQQQGGYNSLQATSAGGGNGGANARSLRV